MGYSTRASPGHSNRIFSAKVLADDENIIVSGGWDNTVQVWDIRQGHAIRSIYGPHICGDSMDVLGGTLLTGSWRPDNQLETWDLLSGERQSTIPWSLTNSGAACLLYAAQYSKEGQGQFIGAGGSGANEAKIFDTTKGNAVVGTVTGMTRGIFALDFSPECQKVAIAGGDSSIRILDIVKKEDS